MISSKNINRRVFKRQIRKIKLCPLAHLNNIKNSIHEFQSKNVKLIDQLYEGLFIPSSGENSESFKRENYTDMSKSEIKEPYIKKNENGVEFTFRIENLFTLCQK